MKGVAALALLVGLACGDRETPAPAAPPPPPARPAVARPAPRSLSHVLEGTELAGATPIAPCMVRVRSDGPSSLESVLVRGEHAFAIDGGYRRDDGSMIICQAHLRAVFELDARGRGKRWEVGVGREDADCKVTEHRIRCTSGSSVFDGIFDGELVLSEHASLSRRRLLRLDWPPFHPCDILVERAWSELAPARAYLGTPGDDAARRAFIVGSTDFREQCDKAPPEKRACLVEQRSILRDFDRCGLDPPRYDSDALLREPEPPPLAAADARARERWLLGRWTQDLERGRELEWTFERSGRSRRGPTEWTRYAVTRAGMLHLEADGMTADWRYARDGDDRFYLDGLSCPRDLAHATVSLGGSDVLVIRGSTCKTITPTHVLRDATCEPYEGDLEVTYVSWHGKAHKKLVRIVDGCYVRDEIEPYVRYR